jgi:hypothetical protein
MDIVQKPSNAESIALYVVCDMANNHVAHSPVMETVLII